MKTLASQGLFISQVNSILKFTVSDPYSDKEIPGTIDGNNFGTWIDSEVFTLCNMVLISIHCKVKTQPLAKTVAKILLANGYRNVRLEYRVRGRKVSVLQVEGGNR